MAQHSNSKIVTDGLVFNFDMNNTKSWIGAPTTNLLPGGAANGYPTTSNSWGTYNTNQYNSNTYFSIGTISSVSGNIVTTSSAHPLRTYDVVTPQTTGGGVTAGTNYLVQKLSSNTFSLHAYTGDQSGSTGFNTQNSILFNQQISINSTSFPTMWWGPPHLPNSGLVKEVISKGFRHKGRVHDCMRIHYPRSEVDGFAYGVDAVVTPSTAHTVSFYARAVTSSAVGKGVSYQIYNYGANAAAGYSFGFTLGQVGVWEKKTMTFTPTNANCVSYWFADPGPFSWELSEIMFNAGSVPHEYTETTRSSTQALLDLTGNSTITASSLTYNSDGTFSFNGTSDRLQIPISGNPTMYCMEVAIKNYKAISPNTSMSPYYSAIGFTANGYSTIGLNLGEWTGSLANETLSFWHYGAANAAVSIQDTIDANWNIYSINWNGSSYDIWVNGTKRTISSSFGTMNPITNLTKISVGYNEGWNYWFNGNIGSLKVYNRQLSDNEVRQNFNALRGRYGV